MECSILLFCGHCGVRCGLQYLFNDAIQAMNEYVKEYEDKIKHLEKVINDMENGRQ